MISHNLPLFPHDFQLCLSMFVLFPIIPDKISYHFSIYNRWGQRVFYSEKLSEKWDGTFMGNQQPAEVYLYRLDYTVSNGFQDKNYQSKGQLTLLR